jgi:hypothetical protein
LRCPAFTIRARDGDAVDSAARTPGEIIDETTTTVRIVPSGVTATSIHAATLAPARDVVLGAVCAPRGADGYTSADVPAMCVARACNGSAYRELRWRRARC